LIDLSLITPLWIGVEYPLNSIYSLSSSASYTYISLESSSYAFINTSPGSWWNACPSQGLLLLYSIDISIVDNAILAFWVY